MNIKIISTKIQNLNLYNDNKLEVDFIAEKRVFENEKDNYIVSNLFNTVYQLNTLAFIGKNAAGKTMTLNILSDILKIYIHNKSLSEIKNLDIFFDSELFIENIITDGTTLYKINSTIKKDSLGDLYFYEESMKSLKITTAISKKNLENQFKNIKAEKRSDLNNDFLKKEDSIFSSILNKNKYSTFVGDLHQLTNFNFPIYFTSNIPLSFVNYLDPSIEEFKVIESEKNPANPSEKNFSIKFKGANQNIIVDSFQLQSYLSSGTIKGINILTNAKVALISGGYLLIDEIENHLNKSIVISLINLFNSEINKYGATLIFTTHYSEILDSLTRSDSIYILDKFEKININKFSKKAKDEDRIDKKKSDLVLSGKVATSPSYISYMNLKNDLKKALYKKEEFDL